MKIDTIKIDNIRSYKKQTIPLDEGITVITGPNGSGKSSSLEAMFIALYGSKAIISPDQKINDVINNASTNGNCEVHFNHFGHDYIIEREYSINTRTGNASNKKSLLKKDGVFLAEQYGNTYSEICKILNMDENAFRNCVYIRQGEIDILINASSTERQKMIDDLLHIGKLEEYHARSKNALTSIKRMIRDKDTLIDSAMKKRNEIANTNPIEQLTQLKKEEDKLKKELEELHVKSRTINARVTEISTQIEAYDLNVKEKGELNEKVLSLKQQKTKLEEDISGMILRMAEIKIDISNLKKITDDLCQKVDIDEVNLENMDTVLNAFETSVNDLHTAVMETKSRIEGISKDITNNENMNAEFLKEISKINDSNENMNNTISEHESNIKEKNTKITEINERIMSNLNASRSGSVDELKGNVDKLKQKEEQASKVLNDAKLEKQSVDSTKKSDDALIASLGEQIQAETKRKTELSSQYDDLTNTIAGYRTDIEQHNEQIHSKETEIHGMLHTAGIEQNIEMTLDALNKFKDQLSEARNSISGEEKQIEARKEALENQKTKAQSLTGRSVCPTCEQEVDPEHIKNHIIEIDFKIAEHNTQMVEVHAEMDVNKRHTDCIVSAISKYDEITGLKTSINTLDTKIESSTATLDGLKRSVDTSNDQLLILNIKKENLANKLEDTDIKLGEMHDRIQQLSDEYDGHKQVHEQSKNILDSLIEDKSRESVINAEIDGLNKQIESLKKIIEQNSKKIETIQSNIVKKTEEINSLTNQKSELDKQMQREDSTHLAKKQEYEIVKTIKKNLQDISSFKSDINNLNEQADIKRQSVTIVGNQISDNKKHIQKIDEKLEGINVDEDRDKLKKFNDASASYEKLINDVNEKNNNIQQKIGNIQTNIVEMNELSDELNVLKNKKDYLMTIAEDVDILDMTYTQTRTEIRARNINTLNSYVNEMFNLMSIDNAYSHVLLDNDYNIQVFQKDGTALDPKQLSGGERAILNIVFRCAIYRLLAHGFSSESSEALPPIVMDEPTTFLDREHVKQLIQLLDTMKSLGVNQIIVVTHDDTLIDAADTVYRVEKDSTTNISKMHRTAETKLGFVL